MTESDRLYRATTHLIRNTTPSTTPLSLVAIATSVARDYDVDLDDLLDGYEESTQGEAVAS
jgi:hypothetical protein